MTDLKASQPVNQQDGASTTPDAKTSNQKLADALVNLVQAFSEWQRHIVEKQQRAKQEQFASMKPISISDPAVNEPISSSQHALLVFEETKWPLTKPEPSFAWIGKNYYGHEACRTTYYTDGKYMYKNGTDQSARYCTISNFQPEFGGAWRGSGFTWKVRAHLQNRECALRDAKNDAERDKLIADFKMPFVEAVYYCGGN